jgi:hypothetical protein
MSPSTELLGHLATGTLSAVVGAGILLVVTWDRQVGIARAEYRMNRAERQSEELLRAAMAVSDAVQPRAIEAADNSVTGELLAVDHVEVDEDAPAEDTDRTGMWRVLLGLASDLVDRAHDWLPNLLQQWRERNDIGSGEQATSGDLFAVDPDQPNDFDPATGRLVQVVYPPVNPTYKSHRCLSDEHRDRDLNYRSRHTAKGYETSIYPVINPSIPAQRDGGES